MEHTEVNNPNAVDYAHITYKAQAEIIRLVQLSNSRQSKTESPEIYREWAYGAFLFWKSLAGSNARPGDVLRLEMLATGESPI